MKRSVKTVLLAALIAALCAAPASAAKGGSGNVSKKPAQSAAKSAKKQASAGRNTVAKMPVEEFFALCKEGKADEVEKALAEKRAYVNAQDGKGVTALMVSIRENQPAVFDVLLKFHAKIDVQTKEGVTALMGAAFLNRFEMAELLVKSGASVNLRTDKHGLTALQSACASGTDNPELVDFLIAHGADPELRDNDRITPLMIAAESGNKRVAEVLIKAGASTEARDGWGQKALHRAAANGKSEVAELLIKAGTDVNSRGYIGMTPIMYAAESGHKNVIDLILKNGGIVKVSLLVNAADNNGKTSVMYAAGTPKSGEALDALIGYGADLKARDKKGHNVLWHLSQNKEMPPEEKKRYADKIFSLMQK